MPYYVTRDLDYGGYFVLDANGSEVDGPYSTRTLAWEMASDMAFNDEMALREAEQDEIDAKRDAEFAMLDMEVA